MYPGVEIAANRPTSVAHNDVAKAVGHELAS